MTATSNHRKQVAISLLRCANREDSIMKKKNTKGKRPTRNAVGSDALVRLLCDEGSFVLVRCDESWGGTYGWTTVGSNAHICGYKTEDAAREGFILDAAGSKLGAVMLKLLRKHYKPNTLGQQRQAADPVSTNPRNPGVAL